MSAPLSIFGSRHWGLVVNLYDANGDIQAETWNSHDIDESTT
jgi:hypothetical protein